MSLRSFLLVLLQISLLYRIENQKWLWHDCMDFLRLDILLGLTGDLMATLAVLLAHLNPYYAYNMSNLSVWHLDCCTLVFGSVYVFMIGLYR